MESDIDPEGYQRGGPTCICGSLYSYGGIVEPGQYAPDCPEHGDQPALADDYAEHKCSCGRAWEGHPNPHAITCPSHLKYGQPETVDLVGALQASIDAAKARRAECRHEDSLYGRCEACGKPWAEQ